MLLANSGRVLFLKRSASARDHPGEWCFPGGGIEDNETSLQAARRETMEETAYTPGAAISLLDSHDGFDTYRVFVDTEFVPALNDEHTECVWAPISTPPQPLHPGVAHTLEKLRNTEMSAFDDGTEIEIADDGSLKAALDKREYDTNGWFEVLDNPLSKVGVYPYSGRVIDPDGSLGLEPGKMYGVFRPPEELGSEECVKSFRLMPWTDVHPSALLGPKERGLVPAEEKGVHGVIGEQTYFNPDDDDGTLYGNIKVFSEALARKIAAGKRELSCGYRCDFVPQEGVWKGQPYQFVQRNMRGNHLSSVDKGRMGSDVRVLDAAERLTFALDMKEPTVADKDDETGKAEDGNESALRKFIGDNAAMCSAVRSMPKDAFEKAAGGKDAAEDEDDDKGGKDSDGDVKDPEGEKGGKESPGKKGDLKAGKDKQAKDSKKAKDEESDEEEEEAEDEDEEDDKKGKAKDSKRGGMDAAEIANLVVPAIRRELASKQKLYQRLSPIVGAFDHDEMTLRDMAAYGLKKVGAPEARDPVTALDFYLAGRAQSASQQREEFSHGGSAHDSQDESFMDSYLQQQ
jgi:hypothetical protein